MQKLFAKLNDRAAEIASINLSDLIQDEDLLATALCAGDFHQIVLTVSEAREGESKHTAAHKALDMGWNPALREYLVKTGYFAKNLRRLIDLSKQNPALSSRLMPIFLSMVTDGEEYGISEKLMLETTAYMEYIRQRDGFAITCIRDDGKVVIRPADGIFDM